MPDFTDHSNKTPEGPEAQEKIDINQEGVTVKPLEDYLGLTVTVHQGPISKDQLPPALPVAPIVGILQATQVVMAKDPAESYEQIKQLGSSTFRTKSILGDMVITYDPKFMRACMRLETRGFEATLPDGSTTEIALLGRKGSITQEATRIMYSMNGFPSLVGSDTGPEWKLMKGLVAPFFDKESIMSMQPKIDEIATQCVERIKANNGEMTMDMLQNFQLHMLLGIVFGVEPEKFHEYEKVPELLSSLGAKAMSLCLAPRLQNMPLDIPLLGNREYVETRDELFALMDKFIIEQAHTPFIQRLTAISEKTGLPILSPEDQKSFLCEIFSAGQETSAKALSLMLFNIANMQETDPAIVEMLRNEISTNEYDPEYIGEDNTLLNAFLMETLRRNSITPNTFLICNYPFTVTDKNGNSFTVPQGTKVVMQMGLMAFDDDLWANDELIARYADGEHTEEELRQMYAGGRFNPLRFFDNNRRSITFTDRFFPFLSGLRSCLGEVLAKNTTKTLASKIAQEGDLEIVNPGVYNASTGVAGRKGLTMRVSSEA